MPPGVRTRRFGGHALGGPTRANLGTGLSNLLSLGYPPYAGSQISRIELCDGSFAEGARSPAEGAEAEPEVVFLLSPGEEVGARTFSFSSCRGPQMWGRVRIDPQHSCQRRAEAVVITRRGSRS